MSALESSTSIVAYLALFVAVGLLFLFVNLLVGYLVRPHNPSEEKGEIYECGEPTIGTSFVQFDLRFYVVALQFIIFDVEIAFFFPWATVYGKANHLHDAGQAQVSQQLSNDVKLLYRELGVRDPGVTGNPADIASGAKTLARATLVDITVFFGVLLIGFAYVWKRGDLEWVRAPHQSRAPPIDMTSSD